MKDDILRELYKEQSSSEAMTAHTIRLPKEISDEIRDFSGKTGIKVATIWRKCVILGWEAINE
ncbi:unnamed protein product [marine sediment metagenome]|uniref:Uncharacterized protein n=1 Tax=marine sediment metagenome TaxID=412755 RepID=X1A5I1_9ZZZZ